MIVEQLYKIGEAYSLGKKPIEIMLMLQNKVRPSGNDKDALILELTVDISDPANIKYEFDISQFIEAKESKYLLGLTSGSGSNYSFSVSPGWKAEDLDDKKIAKNAKKLWNKILSIKKSKVLKEFFENEAQITNLILDDLEERQIELYELFDEILKNNQRTKFNYPLIFKIKDINGCRYLGEIDEMIEMYEIQFFPKIVPKNKEQLSCRFCGNQKNLNQGFTMGMYSITQISFILGFYAKGNSLNAQNIMCNDCYLKTLLGYDVLNNNLTFYAYKLGKKDRYVNHYVIPLNTEPDALKKSVESIKKIHDKKLIKKKNAISKTITDLDHQISELKINLTQAKGKKAIKKYTSECKKLENQKNDKENAKESASVSLSLQEIIKSFPELRGEFFPILDIYYTVTNVKQNPKTIEVVDEILISNENMAKLSKIFKKANDNFPNKSLYDLKNLFNETDGKFFLEYYSSVLNLKQINKTSFNKHVAPVVKNRFFDRILEESDEKTDFYKNFRSLIKTYNMFMFIAKEANIWREC